MNILEEALLHTLLKLILISGKYTLALELTYRGSHLLFLFC